MGVTRPKSVERVGWPTVAALDLRLGLGVGAASTFTSAWIWTRFVPSDAFDFDLEPSNKMLFVRRTWTLSAASMTPMLVGRLSSLDRFFSAFGGECGVGLLPESDLSDFVGDAGGLGSTARTLLTQLSREGNRKPPGVEGGSAVAAFVGAPAMVERGGDSVAGCGLVFIDILLNRGGRGGTGGTDDGTAGRGPVGGGRGSGGGVSDRDIARLRCRGERPKADADSRFDGEAMPGNTGAVGGVEGGTRSGKVSEPAGIIVGDVGDEPCATGDIGGEVEQRETEDSVSEGACGATPTAGRNVRTPTLRDCGTTSDRRCGRPLCACNGPIWISARGNGARGPKVEARGVGSSSKLSDSECEASVPSKDGRIIPEPGSTVLQLLLARMLVVPKIASNGVAGA